MTESVSIHLFDARAPENEIVQFLSEVVPRIGDKVHYWVDYRRHMGPDAHGCEPGEPLDVKGTVSMVDLEYRNMRLGRMPVLAGVYLDDCKVEIPIPEEDEG